MNRNVAYKEKISTRKLRKCPRCNGQDVMLYQADFPAGSITELWMVTCLKCGIRTQHHRTRKKAQADWNRRAFRGKGGKR